MPRGAGNYEKEWLLPLGGLDPMEAQGALLRGEDQGEVPMLRILGQHRLKAAVSEAGEGGEAVGPLRKPPQPG